jgi:ATP-dependent Clp protease protease subunit
MEHDNENTSGEIWVTKFEEESAQTFREQVLEASRRDRNAVIPIYIDSYGGYVDSLAKMIETMDEMPNRFVTICMGKAMSCGAILLSHGDLRFCGKYSRAMIHNVSSGSWGDAYTLKADSEETHRLNKRFMGLLAENCGITYNELQSLIKDATGSKEIWLSAEDAKKFNLVDEVGVPHVAQETAWSFEILTPKPKVNRKKEDPKKTKTKRKK